VSLDESLKAQETLQASRSEMKGILSSLGITNARNTPRKNLASSGKKPGHRGKPQLHLPCTFPNFASSDFVKQLVFDKVAPASAVNELAHLPESERTWFFPVNHMCSEEMKLWLTSFAPADYDLESHDYDYDDVIDSSSVSDINDGCDVEGMEEESGINAKDGKETLNEPLGRNTKSDIITIHDDSTKQLGDINSHKMSRILAHKNINVLSTSNEIQINSSTIPQKSIELQKSNSIHAQEADPPSSPLILKPQNSKKTDSNSIENPSSTPSLNVQHDITSLLKVSVSSGIVPLHQTPSTHSSKFLEFRTPDRSYDPGLSKQQLIYSGSNSAIDQNDIDTGIEMTSDNKIINDEDEDVDFIPATPPKEILANRIIRLEKMKPRNHHNHINNDDMEEEDFMMADTANNHVGGASQGCGLGGIAVEGTNGGSSQGLNSHPFFKTGTSPIQQFFKRESYLFYLSIKCTGVCFTSFKFNAKTIILQLCTTIDLAI
jgi:hypothetical protein